jgi:hypothetical protein
MGPTIGRGQGSRTPPTTEPPPLDTLTLFPTRCEGPSAHRAPQMGAREAGWDTTLEYVACPTLAHAGPSALVALAPHTEVPPVRALHREGAERPCPVRSHERPRGCAKIRSRRQPQHSATSCVSQKQRRPGPHDSEPKPSEPTPPGSHAHKQGPTAHGVLLKADEINSEP